MNAIIREQYEAPVSTNEAIEVHLTYLRSGFDVMQAALPVLRDKIDQLSARVDSKIEALAEKTNARIEAVNTSISEKIERANEQRAAGDATLGERIDKLSEKVSDVHAYQKALFWVLSTLALIGSAVSIAHTFGWI